MTNQKVSTLKQARRAALCGNVAEAIVSLRSHANRGDASASASLAELNEFRAEWADCMHNAGALIRAPHSVYAGNVFDDMVRLLGRAGHETRDWSVVERLAVAAMIRVEDDVVGDDPVKRDGQRKRYLTILHTLRDYARRLGKPPHELVSLFGGIQPPQAQLDLAYFKAYQQAQSQSIGRRDKPSVYRERHFRLAQTFHQYADAINIYERGDMPAEFDCAFFTAKAYAQRHDAVNAWRVLWAHMSKWYPVDPAQIAPVVLITDSCLPSILTPSRSEQILVLPRGPEAK